MPPHFPARSVPSLPPPVQPREAGAAPAGEDWMYEFLWNGERVRAVKNAGVRLLARDGRDLVNRFPRVAAAVARLRAEDVVIDGEILMLECCSPAAVALLSRACDDIAQAQVALLAYDLLCHRGGSLKEMPLLGRRFVLASLVQGTPIILAPLFQGSSDAALAAAAELGLPGIVAKRAGSCYRPNALVTPWLKVLVDAQLPAAGRPSKRGSRAPFTADGAHPAPAVRPAGGSRQGTDAPGGGPSLPPCPSTKKVLECPR